MTIEIEIVLSFYSFKYLVVKLDYCESTYLGNGYIEGGVGYLSGVWLLPWLEGQTGTVVSFLLGG